MDNRATMVFGHEAGKADITNYRPAAEHQRVLAESGDVPHEHPSFPLPLSHVGISGKTTWVLLPWGRLPFDTEITIDLPANRRGIHMSRIERAMSELFAQSFADLRDYAIALGNLVITGQEAGRCSIYLSGKLPILRQNALSGEQSMDTVQVSVDARFVRKGKHVDQTCLIGVGLHHITACPCTQVYNAALFADNSSPFPLPTHSQRSFTRLEVESMNSDQPAYEELLSCLESALHVSRDLLKRPDEAEIVLQSHRKPQFVEDTVRETAREAGHCFGGTLPGATKLVIESLSLESIHIHDVKCRLETSLSEIEQCLVSV